MFKTKSAKEIRRHKPKPNSPEVVYALETLEFNRLLAKDRAGFAKGATAL